MQETKSVLTFDRRDLELRYLTQVAEECRYLETEGVDRVRAELADVFVVLEAMDVPRREEPTDITAIPERHEEMGLEEQVTAQPKTLSPTPVPSLEETRLDEQTAAPPVDHKDGRTTQARGAQPSPPLPFFEALGDHAQLVVLGEPGSGKTTMLQFIALCFATAGWAKARLDLDETRVPVRAELREYDGTERLDQFLVRQMDRAYVPEALAQDWLADGRLAVLLDGLDEVPQDHRIAVVKAIERFAATPEGQRCRIVVTSRIAGYRAARELGGRFAHYVICPFTGPQDAFPYVAGWLRVLKPTSTVAADDEARALLVEIEQSGGLRRLIGNPLLLRLALTIYAEKGELVRGRAELYRRYVEEVIWKRTEARQESDWSPKQIEQALMAVAWALQTQRKLTTRSLAGLVETKVPGVINGQELLDCLRQQLGLLAIYGYEHGPLITFCHLTFREYFVALRLARAWVADRRHTWRFLRQKLHHPAWREPILLLSGMLGMEEATELVRRLLRARSPYERELHRDLLLAGAIIGEGVQVQDALLDRIVRTLFDLFVDVRLRLPRLVFAPSVWADLEHAAQPMHKLPPRVRRVLGYATVGMLAAGVVVKGLVSPVSRGMRALFGLLSGRGRYALLQERIDEALIAIGQHRPDLIVEELGQVLIETTEQAATGSSGEWPDLRSSPETDRDIHQRAAAILGHSKAVDVLARALTSREGRRPAAWALATIKEADPRVIDLLVEAATNHNAYVREAVAWILSVDDGPQAAATLLRLARDPDGTVKEAAVRNLGGPWPYPWAQRSLVALLGVLATADEQDSGLAKAAIEALQRGVLRYRRDQVYLPIVHADTISIDLAQAVPRRQEPLWEAVEALQREGPGSTRAITILVSLAADRADGLHPSGLQEAVIGLLGVLGASRPEMLGSLVELMLTLLEDWRYLPVAPANAIVKLAESRPDEVVSILLGKEQAQVLGQLVAASIPGAVSALIALLRKRDENIRLGAIKALGQAGKDTPEVIEALKEALEDSSEKVREAAMWALARLGVRTESIVAFLSDVLAEGPYPYGLSSSEVAWLLWNLGASTPEVVSVLVEWCVLYWDDSTDKALETLPRLHLAAPRTVESGLVEAVQSREDDAGFRLGNRPTDRVRAAEAIGYLGLNTPAVREALLKALQDVKGARNSAAWALGRIDSTHPSAETAKVLFGVLEESKNPGEIRPILSLGYVDQDCAEVKAALLDVLRDARDRYNSTAAAIALGQLGVHSPNVVNRLLSVWKLPLAQRPGDFIGADAWERGTAIMRELARSHPDSLRTTLVTATKKGSVAAIEVLSECLADRMDVATLRRITQALRWQLTDPQIDADLDYAALDRVVTKLLELRMGQLTMRSDLFVTASPAGRTSSELARICVSVIIAAFSGMAADWLNGLLQERYKLASSSRIGLIAAILVLVLALAAEIWFRWRRRRLAAEPS